MQAHMQNKKAIEKKIPNPSPPYTHRQEPKRRNRSKLYEDLRGHTNRQKDYYNQTVKKMNSNDYWQTSKASAKQKDRLLYSDNPG